MRPAKRRAVLAMSDVEYRAMWMQALTYLENTKLQLTSVEIVLGKAIRAAGLVDDDEEYPDLVSCGLELVELVQTMFKNLTVVRTDSMRGHHFLDALRREFQRTGRASDEIAVQT